MMHTRSYSTSTVLAVLRAGLDPQISDVRTYPTLPYVGFTGSHC